MIKVSEELLNDSVFDLPSYIAREFARRIGAAEEEAFFTGNGTGRPLGILADTGRRGDRRDRRQRYGITMDEIMDLYYSLRAPYRRNAVFIMNDSTIKAIRKLKNGNGDYLWQPSLTAGQPGHAAQSSGLHLQLYAHHRRHQQGHPVWRPGLLLGGRPRRPFFSSG